MTHKARACRCGIAAVAAAIAICFTVAPAAASVTILSSPSASNPLNLTAGNNGIASNTEIYGFLEKSNVLVSTSEDKTLNWVPADGQKTYSSTSKPGSPETLPTGTYDSWYFHFNAKSGSASTTGVVTFTKPILGAEFLNGQLNDGDDSFKNQYATYASSDRGLEFTSGGDTITIWFQDPFTVSFDLLHTTSAVDDVRLLLTPGAVVVLPEPATLVIWSLLGAGSWLGMRVWRRRGPGLGDDMSAPVPMARNPWSPESRQAIHQIIARGNGSRS